MDQHRNFGAAILRLRTFLHSVLEDYLSARTTARIIDLAHRLDRRMLALSLALEDMLPGIDDQAYPKERGDAGGAAHLVGRPAPPARRRLSAADHRRLGPTFHRLVNSVSRLAGAVENAMPKTSRPARRAWALTKAVDRLRSELDDRFCEVCPDAESIAGVYYGPMLGTVEELMTQAEEVAHAR